MKLVSLLATIGAVWCVLGAIVLGPGVLIYPLAWAAVFAVLFGVHKVVQNRENQGQKRSGATNKSANSVSSGGISGDQRTAMVR